MEQLTRHSISVRALVLDLDSQASRDRDFNPAFTNNPLKTWIGEVGAVIFSRRWLYGIDVKTQVQALSKRLRNFASSVPYGYPIRVDVLIRTVPLVTRTRIVGRMTMTMPKVVMFRRRAETEKI